jgi:hypothetical protein
MIITKIYVERSLSRNKMYRVPVHEFTALINGREKVYWDVLQILLNACL